MRGFFFRFKKKREKIFHTCTMNMRGYFFHPSKKKQRDLDYQACSSDMVGYFFQGFNFFFFEKNTHACSSDMRVILPYTAFEPWFMSFLTFFPIKRYLKRYHFYSKMVLLGDLFGQKKVPFWLKMRSLQTYRIFLS